MAGGPRVSIVLQVRPESGSLRACVASLIWQTRPPWELLVVAPAGDPPAASYLRGVRDTAPVRVEMLEVHTHPSGFEAIAWVLGAARGDAVVFLDDATIVTSGWLDHLATLSEVHPSLVTVSPFRGPEGGAGDGPDDDDSLDELERINSRSIRRGTLNYGQWAVAKQIDGCFYVRRRALADAPGLQGSLAYPISACELFGGLPEPAARHAIALDTYVGSIGHLECPLEPPFRDDEPPRWPGTVAGAGSSGEAGHALPPDFNPDGLLPPGDYPLTFPELRDSMLVCGPPGAARWDPEWRLMLADNLEILARQLAALDLKQLYIAGSFVERKAKPGDLDGYFVCTPDELFRGNLYQRLNAIDGERVWTMEWADRRHGPTTGPFPRPPMWHKYRVELQANHGQSTTSFRDHYGRPLDYPSAFRRSKVNMKPKGIVRMLY